ncbi:MULTISPECIES: hypothetical protein [unclassified Sphingobacterium]|jgi:hypothetical protein|uniref:hypothetical protein n=1 Tax=Sphingobacterium TaxID=28453 RepID=UPI00135724D5|nr:MULTISPECIES: hypothetical protein [unclassified Sphingobacterium]MCS4163769.1 hypothetical protein [Sphingobacterium sp. BIGb0116]
MVRYIYKRLLFFIVFLFFCSCKLYRNRGKEDQREERIQSHYKRQVDVVYKELKDSQSRYWHFWTNSSFRFHPDSGLIGQNGQLAMLESKVNTRAKNELSTSSSDSYMQTKYVLSTDKRSAWAVPKLWLIGFVLVAVAITWKFRNFFKTFLR